MSVAYTKDNIRKQQQAAQEYNEKRAHNTNPALYCIGRTERIIRFVREHGGVHDVRIVSGALVIYWTDGTTAVCAPTARAVRNILGY